MMSESKRQTQTNHPCNEVYNTHVDQMNHQEAFSHDRCQMSNMNRQDGYQMQNRNTYTQYRYRTNNIHTHIDIGGTIAIHLCIARIAIRCTTTTQIDMIDIL